MKKLARIRVRCTRPIANEMCRYDNAQIVDEKVVDDRFAKMFLPDEMEEYNRHVVCEFVIEGKSHTIARWHSFCVEPEVVNG